MEFLIIIVILAFVIGLISRNKGDGMLDTLSSGCGTIIWIVLIIAAIVIFMMMGK